MPLNHFRNFRILLLHFPSLNFYWQHNLVFHLPSPKKLVKHTRRSHVTWITDSLDQGSWTAGIFVCFGGWLVCLVVWFFPVEFSGFPLKWLSFYSVKQNFNASSCLYFVPLNVHHLLMVNKFVSFIRCSKKVLLLFRTSSATCELIRECNFSLCIPNPDSYFDKFL